MLKSEIQFELHCVFIFFLDSIQFEQRLKLSKSVWIKCHNKEFKTLQFTTSQTYLCLSKSITINCQQPNASSFLSICQITWIVQSINQLINLSHFTNIESELASRRRKPSEPFLLVTRMTSKTVTVCFLTEIQYSFTFTCQRVQQQMVNIQNIFYS